MCDLHARAKTAFCAKGERPATSRKEQIEVTRVLPCFVLCLNWQILARSVSFV